MYGDSDPESDIDWSPSQHNEQEDDSHEEEEEEEEEKDREEVPYIFVGFKMSLVSVLVAFLKMPSKWGTKLTFNIENCFHAKTQLRKKLMIFSRDAF